MMSKIINATIKILVPVEFEDDEFEIDEVILEERDGDTNANL